MRPKGSAIPYSLPVCIYSQVGDSLRTITLTSLARNKLAASRLSPVLMLTVRCISDTCWRFEPRMFAARGDDSLLASSGGRSGVWDWSRALPARTSLVSTGLCCHASITVRGTGTVMWAFWCGDSGECSWKLHKRLGGSGS